MGVAPHRVEPPRMVAVRHKPLRWPIDAQLPEWPKNCPHQRAHRAARSISGDPHQLRGRTRNGTLLIPQHIRQSAHRGEKPAPPRNFDHVDRELGEQILRFHDPRRFGSVLWHGDAADGDAGVRIHVCQSLRAEPLDPAFDGEHIYRHPQPSLSGR